MNGRLYDPLLHRFLSPDNFVQDPFNTQNFNRYGYVLNYPLKYTDPSGEFLIAALIGVAYGALVGAAVSATVYTISGAITGNWSWSGLGTSMLYGAIGGAISGGLSGIAASLGNSASSFLHSTTYNMMSEAASQAGTNAIMGDELTIGSVIGSFAGGLAGAKIGNWSGVKGSWLKNAAGEIGFNTLKGTIRVAINGGIEAGFIKGNIGKGLLKGAKGGALGGFSQSLSMVAAFGATYKPSDSQMKYANQMAEAFGLSADNVAWRKGGAYQALQPLWSQGYKREVTWGRSVATFKETNADIFGHEFGHIIQTNQQGWGPFQGRGIFEQLWVGPAVYGRPGSNEYAAERYLHPFGGWSMQGFCPVH